MTINSYYLTFMIHLIAITAIRDVIEPLKVCSHFFWQEETCFRVIIGAGHKQKKKKILKSFASDLQPRVHRFPRSRLPASVEFFNKASMCAATSPQDAGHCLHTSICLCMVHMVSLQWRGMAMLNLYCLKWVYPNFSSQLLASWLERQILRRTQQQSRCRKLNVCCRMHVKIM